MYYFVLNTSTRQIGAYPKVYAPGETHIDKLEYARLKSMKLPNNLIVVERDNPHESVKVESKPEPKVYEEPLKGAPKADEKPAAKVLSKKKVAPKEDNAS